MITKEQIDRINELARKVKSGETLTPEEVSERDILRRAYIDSVKASLTGHLDSITVMEPDGSKHKLKKKEE